MFRWSHRICLTSLACLGILAPLALGLPLSGDLKGVLRLQDGTGLPWTLSLQPAGPATSGAPDEADREATFTLRHAHPATPGGDAASPASDTPATLDVRIHARLDSSLRNGSWRIEQAHIDLGAWWAAIRSLAGLDATLGEWSMLGRATLTGQGALSDGKPRGRVTLNVEDGAFFNYASEIEIEGISLTLACEDLLRWTLAEGQRLSIGRIAAAGMEASDARFEFALSANRVIRVQRAELSTLGGHMRLLPFEVSSLDPATLSVTATAEVENLSLAETARLIPEALSEAQGRLQGRLTLSWRPATGLSLGKGELRVEKNAPAQIRLAAKPGFFTQSLWARTKVLGFITVENPAYQVLRQVELGELALQVESLDVQLMPDGPHGARSALVSITAYPADRKAVKVITFQVNVGGALLKVLEIGLNNQMPGTP